MSNQLTELKNFFLSFNILSEEEIDKSLPFYKFKTLKKSDFFIKEGEICKSVAYVISGSFRSFYCTNEGDEITYCINFPKSFQTAYTSYITGQASKENIQAVTDAELLVINKSDIEMLAKESLKWTQFLKIMAEYQYIELENRIFELQRYTAKERYLNLLTGRPEYIEQIPLQYLASYLGITQRHLSRLRKEISF